MANRLLSEVGECTVQSDTISFNAVGLARERGAQSRMALGLLAEMCECTVQPDTISLSAAASACERGTQ